MTASFERKRLTITLHDDEIRDLLGILTHYELQTENPFRAKYSTTLKQTAMCALLSDTTDRSRVAGLAAVEEAS